MSDDPDSTPDPRGRPRRRPGPMAGHRCGLGVSLSLVVSLGLTQIPVWALGPGPRSRASAFTPCRRQGERHFDVIVYGDEPAGVMTALELRAQLQQLTGRPRPRIALLTASDTRDGLGGTIARSGLAYLDRNQVPRDMWDTLPPFAPSSDLYSRFLKLSGARQIAVDPRQASRAFRRALRQARITLLTDVTILGSELETPGAGGSPHPDRPATQRLCVLETGRQGRLGADLFLDASLGADLAHRSGVRFRGGLGPGPLSEESLALGWIFEVEGLTIQRLRALETRLTQRLLDPQDTEAREWLRLWPAYHHNRRRLAEDLLDADGRARLVFSSTTDSADQQSPALSIALHGEQGLRPGLRLAPARLDAANLAILPDRLSFNALLFRNNAARNRAVLAHHSRPLNWMLPVAGDVESFFLRHGARRVHWMPELYVRSADQIAHPLRPLTAGLMARGGVPRWEALGTFTYHLDLRGGPTEVIPPAKPTFNFGYRHTLPQEVSNLAVLGPASGFGGLGEGAGRIIELNISVGQGLAIAAALALNQGIPLAAVDPHQVAQLMPPGYPPYGRPSGSTGVQLMLSRLRYLIEAWMPRLPRESAGWSRPVG